MKLGAARLCCAALGLVLTGCGASSPPVVCPGATLVPDLQSVAKFGPGSGRQAQDITYGARLLAVSVTCDADDDKHGLDVSTKLGVAAERGKPDIESGTVTYFVAIVDTRDAILNERDFDIDLRFSTTQSRIEITEEHDEFIPLPKGGSGRNYRLLFGFRLNPEELRYNRDHEPGGQPKGSGAIPEGAKPDQEPKKPD